MLHNIFSKKSPKPFFLELLRSIITIIFVAQNNVNIFKLAEFKSKFYIFFCSKVNSGNLCDHKNWLHMGNFETKFDHVLKDVSDRSKP